MQNIDWKNIKMVYLSFKEFVEKVDRMPVVNWVKSIPKEIDAKGNKVDASEEFAFYRVLGEDGQSLLMNDTYADPRRFIKNPNQNHEYLVPIL